MNETTTRRQSGVWSRFKPYPAYKDSGAEWLGRIPLHWEIKRLKYLADLNMGQSPDSDECNRDGEGTPFLQGNAEFGKRNPVPKLFCPTAKKRAKPGDYLLSVRAPVGAINIADQEYGIGRGLCAITPKPAELRHDYMGYLLEVVRLQLDIVATGSTYPAVSVDQVGSIVCPVPPAEEQLVIASFLDRGTTKIDTLISREERLIALLEEKRVAFITRAVTKGLDLTVPMKDSGSVWLGKIPEHWETRPLKRQFKVVNGSTPKSSDERYWDGDIPWVTPEDLGSLENRVIFVTARAITQGGYESCGTKLVPIKSLVLSTRAPIGHLAVAGVPLCTNQGCRALVSLGGCSEEFFYYQLIAARPELESWGQGSTFIELSKTKLEGILIGVPPLKEQQAIATFLDGETAKIDALILKIREAIYKQKEYRTALISAAVTGKIDVRQETS